MKICEANGKDNVPIYFDADKIICYYWNFNYRCIDVKLIGDVTIRVYENIDNFSNELTKIFYNKKEE